MKEPPSNYKNSTPDNQVDSLKVIGTVSIVGGLIHGAISSEPFFRDEGSHFYSRKELCWDLALSTAMVGFGAYSLMERKKLLNKVNEATDKQF